MITYETLKTFCGHDCLRPPMNYACRREDGWWATDGVRIICVPMTECQQGDVRFLCDEMPKDVGRFPNVEAVVDVKGFESKFLVSVKAIKEAMAKLPLTDEMVEVQREMTFVICPECNGEGEISLSAVTSSSMDIGTHATPRLNETQTSGCASYFSLRSTIGVWNLTPTCFPFHSKKVQRSIPTTRILKIAFL